MRKKTTNGNNYHTYIWAVILIIGIGFGYFYGHNEGYMKAMYKKNKLINKDTNMKGTTATFTCDDNKSISATFYPEHDTYVDLKLSDGRALTVPHAISGSGARYATTDDAFVFWNKGNTAFITENGTTTYANCVTQTNSSDN